MDGIIEAIEVFAFVTGVIYVILEILQKNSMWVIGIATGVACAYSFAIQHLYASMALNVYYVVMSVIGLYQWRKDASALSATSTDGNDTIHLNRLTPKVIFVSVGILVFGTILTYLLLKSLGDSSSLLDAVVTVMSAVATWWLAKSIPQQWLIWIVADTLSLVLCLVSGMYWMALMYVAYASSAVYGYHHWTTKGKYLS